MKKRTSLIIPAIVLSIVFGVGVHSIYASTDAQPTSLITKIAQKFNVSEDDVKSIFEEDRQEHETLMKKNYEDMLTGAVASGEITEKQKQMIIAKNEELRSAHGENREIFMNLSAEERELQRDEHRAEMEKEREELELWAKENGIDLKYLMMSEGHGPHDGRGSREEK